MRTLFADPKIQFVFERIFACETRKDVVMAFLNDMLQLNEAHRIVSVDILPRHQQRKVQELQHSMLDVQCVDARGVRYVVELEVLHIEALEKQLALDATRGYTMLRDVADNCPKMNDVIDITICCFGVWPNKAQNDADPVPHVPMLSHWVKGAGDVRFVFMELPKYNGSDHPESSIDKWAYFFANARHLEAMPEALSHPPFKDALEAARTAWFLEEEWDEYIREGMAIQDARGAITYAVKQGFERGRAMSARRVLRVVLNARGLTPGPQDEARIEGCNDVATLERWHGQAATAATITEALM